MHISATHKNARIAPRKVRPLARLLRHMSAAQAELQLRYLPGREVRDVILAVLKSAIANAQHNAGLHVEDLIVNNVQVNAGFAFKRFRPGFKGSANPFKKRTSHITVTLSSGQKARKARTAKIKTVSADEYVASPEPLVSETKDKEVKPVEKDVPKSKEQEAFGKMRALQGGGDKKKSFRRKSVG